MRARTTTRRGQLGLDTGCGWSTIDCAYT